MTPERWAEIDRVWHAVLALPEDERAAALVELCGSDSGLRAEVESLIANLAQANAPGFGAVPEPKGGYEPSPDGQRFLVPISVSEASPASVILNWKPPVR